MTQGNEVKKILCSSQQSNIPYITKALLDSTSAKGLVILQTVLLWYQRCRDPGSMHVDLAFNKPYKQHETSRTVHNGCHLTLVRPFASFGHTYMNMLLANTWQRSRLDIHSHITRASSIVQWLSQCNCSACDARTLCSWAVVNYRLSWKHNETFLCTKDHQRVNNYYIKPHTYCAFQ